jgi:hypothetical protein
MMADEIPVPRPRPSRPVIFVVGQLLALALVILLGFLYLCLRLNEVYGPGGELERGHRKSSAQPGHPTHQQFLMKIANPIVRQDV